MNERIRDAKVAEELAAQAGTDETPPFTLADTIQPVIFAPQRPPLAASGYFPGTVGIISPAVALNTSHVGIFGSGFSRAIVRVNWLLIINNVAAVNTFTIRRVDSPFTGFPSVPAIPGYSAAGNPATTGVFSVTKSDTVGAQGSLLATVVVHANSSQKIDGPWILNDGILLVAESTVNSSCRAMFGYEHWAAIRRQPVGG